MQVKTDKWGFANIDGSLNARVGLLSALYAIVMQPTIGSRCHVEDALECFVETALFLISAFERNRFYGIF